MYSEPLSVWRMPFSTIRPCFLRCLLIYSAKSAALISDLSSAKPKNCTPQLISRNVYCTLGRRFILICHQYSGISKRSLVSSHTRSKRANCFLISRRFCLVTCFLRRRRLDTPFLRHILRMVLADSGSFSSILTWSAPIRLYTAFRATIFFALVSDMALGEL